MVTLKMISSQCPVLRETDVCLITGDGRCLEQDISTFMSHPVPHDVMAIARSFKRYPGNVLHWAMVDCEANKWWAEHLPMINNGKFPIRHTLGKCAGFDVNWDDGQEDGAMWYGTSALFATLVAINLGYEKIILAGCPMDKNGHWYFPDETGPDWREEDYDIWKEFATCEEVSRVKSYSGFTGELLGVPTKEWIGE